MNLLVLTGSRADYGLLEWPLKLLRADPFFDVRLLRLWGDTVADAFERVTLCERPDVLLVLGDRFEIMGAALAAHLRRIPIAHIGGGDVTEGSYDDAMRDSISRMATLHFVTSTSAMARLTHMGYRNVHLVGNPGIDYIRNAAWRRERPMSQPYVVISYQPETIDGTNEIESLLRSLPLDRYRVFLLPNPDAGSDIIEGAILDYCREMPFSKCYEFLPHDEFLNLIFHCDEFIGNSSSMLYEAPELKVKTRMIGKRQRGRTIPRGDGLASERMLKILKFTAGTL